MNEVLNLSGSHGSLGLVWLLAVSAAKATVLLACAALACATLRRLPAAARHLVWASTLCATLLLPLSSFVRVWEVPVLPAALAPPDASVAGEVNRQSNTPIAAPELTGADVARGSSGSTEARTAARPKVRVRAGSFAETPRAAEASAVAAPTGEDARPAQEDSRQFAPALAGAVLAVWAAGLLLLLVRLLVGLAATYSLSRRAAGFEDAELNALFSSLAAELNLKGTTRLLRSEHTSMPIVCGVWRPSVLLPAGAEGWPAERRRMVLLHELTHVKRRDCLTQAVAQAACAFYWFNPLVWYAARRLRVERERACDDYVLSAGSRPSDYAHHLLEIARSVRERSLFRWSQTASVAMARRSQLEGRLVAILSKGRRRGAVSRAASLSLLALTCAALLALGALSPTAIGARRAHVSPNAGVERERPETSSADSTPGDSPSVRPEQGAVAGAQTANAGETFKATETTHAAGASPTGPALDEGRTGQQGEPTQPAAAQTVTRRTAEPDDEADAGESENVVEAVVERTRTRPELEDTRTRTRPQVAPIVNVAYRQGAAPAGREGSGDFIDEMAAAGYTGLSVDELIRLKTAGVTGEYVRALRATGLVNLTPKEVASLSLQGVTPAYIKAMRAAGYAELSAKELASLRALDITPEDIRAWRDAGYPNLTPRQLTDFAAHEITPAFISQMRAAGYGDLSPKELVSLRVFEITPDFIREARARLGALSVRQLIALKNAGIMDGDKGKNKDKDKDKDENRD